MNKGSQFSFHRCSWTFYKLVAEEEEDAFGKVTLYIRNHWTRVDPKLQSFVSCPAYDNFFSFFVLVLFLEIKDVLFAMFF